MMGKKDITHCHTNPLTLVMSTPVECLHVWQYMSRSTHISVGAC